MKHSAPLTRTCQVLCLLACLCLAAAALAETKSYFSPIVDVDVERGFLFISTSSGILIVQASEAAKPHLGKLPRPGMIDVVVERTKGRKVALLKSWKVVGGESSCMVFDGKQCK